METLLKVKQKMEAAENNWLIPFMDFVDDFRREKSVSSIGRPLAPSNEKIDALLASTIEFLGYELNLEIPEWVESIPPCIDPWFVSGVENLKAIALVESPVFFRRRKIFVLQNFLERA